MISASRSVTAGFKMGGVRSRSSLLSGTDPLGVSDLFVTVEVVTLVKGEMEAEGELVEGVGTVDAASVMEKSCGSVVLLFGISECVVVLMMELVLFTSDSVGLVDSYSVGG